MRDSFVITGYIIQKFPDKDMIYVQTHDFTESMVYPVRVSPDMMAHIENHKLVNVNILGHFGYYNKKKVINLIADKIRYVEVTN